MHSEMHCPGCKHLLRSEFWLNDRQARCPFCSTDLEFVPFPALTAAHTVARPAAASLGEDATCFFHATNRAEAVCSGCGRLLCSVCAVDFAGQCLCPSCIAGRSAAKPDTVKSRILWDSCALMLAGLPVLMWPLTIVTAPTAVGLAIYGWNKPCSLVRGSKIRLLAAMILGGLQIAGWCIGIVALLSRRHGT